MIQSVSLNPRPVGFNQWVGQVLEGVCVERDGKEAGL